MRQEIHTQPVDGVVVADDLLCVAFRDILLKDYIDNLAEVQTQEVLSIII